MQIILMKICGKITVDPYYSLITILWLYDCLVKSNLENMIFVHSVLTTVHFATSISVFIRLFWQYCKSLHRTALWQYLIFYIIVAPR